MGCTLCVVAIMEFIALCPRNTIIPHSGTIHLQLSITQFIVHGELSVSWPHEQGYQQFSYDLWPLLFNCYLCFGWSVQFVNVIQLFTVAHSCTWCFGFVPDNQGVEFVACSYHHALMVILELLAGQLLICVLKHYFPPLGSSWVPGTCLATYCGTILSYNTVVV